MFKNVILSAVLIGFIAVQLADSLQCYTCISPSDCKNPHKETCNNQTANATSHALALHHNNIPAINGSSYFLCAINVYTFANNKTVNSQVQGCVHPSINVCSLQLKPEFGNQGWKRSCNTCSGNLCNKNPAGTYSSSGFTILVSALSLVLAKILT